MRYEPGLYWNSILAFSAPPPGSKIVRVAVCRLPGGGMVTSPGRSCEEESVVGQLERLAGVHLVVDVEVRTRPPHRYHRLQRPRDDDAAAGVEGGQRRLA